MLQVKCTPKWIGTKAKLYSCFLLLYDVVCLCVDRISVLLEMTGFIMVQLLLLKNHVILGNKISLRFFVYKYIMLVIALIFF